MCFVVDINECKKKSARAKNAREIYCLDRYQTTKMSLCFVVDINECKKKSACAKNAKCTNAEGSYSCICAQGYSGDGLNFCDGKGFYILRSLIPGFQF